MLIMVLCLITSCTKDRYVYVELPREPITCIDGIKTPLDMATCLAEYKEKY